MQEILYIAARHPCPGKVKTRLARTVGEEAAARLYAAFLSDLARAFAGAPFPVRWYATGGWEGPHLDQGEGDWATRQARLFDTAGARGEESVVLIASDSPQLTPAIVSEAFGLLRRHDLVLGPVFDGGYYLIGMRGRHDVLSGLRMTTSTVTRDIIERARRMHLSVGLLPPTFDVDEWADLAHLNAVLEARPDLAHTRTAMRSLRASEAA